MKDEIIHVGFALDGAIIEFPFSAGYYMKVCNPYTGVGGVVELPKGAYYSYHDLEKRGIGQYCKVLYKNLDEMYREEEE